MIDYTTISELPNPYSINNELIVQSKDNSKLILTAIVIIGGVLVTAYLIREYKLKKDRDEFTA